jgi:hypothetical protein
MVHGTTLRDTVRDRTVGGGVAGMDRSRVGGDVAGTGKSRVGEGTRRSAV